MFELGSVAVSSRASEVVNMFNIDILLRRHLEIDDDTNGSNRAINMNTVRQGFGSIINIFNIGDKRVSIHTVHQLGGGAYTRIYLSDEY